MRNASTARSRPDLDALRPTLPAVLHHLGVIEDERDRGRCCCPLCYSSNRTAFSYTPEVWHCHRCGAGGDVFELVRALRKCSFPQAVEIVAETAGLSASNLPQINQAEIARRETNGRKRAALARWRSGRHSEWLCLIYDLEREAEQLAPHFMDRDLDGQDADGEGWRLLASLYRDLEVATLQAARLSDPNEAEWAQAWLDERAGKVPTPAEMRV